MDKLDLVNKLNRERAQEIKKQKDGDNFKEIPNFKPGDTLNIGIRVVEGEKERIQYFKGIVIAMSGGGINETFTVRKISNGVGVERILPLNSPNIQSIEVLNQGHVRRAKLYYLRGMSDKKIKAKLR